jgi:hypothetical protein
MVVRTPALRSPRPSSFFLPALDGDMTPSLPGQRDYSTVRLTRHALERFTERFGGDADAAEPASPSDPEPAEASLRIALARTRRLGTNPDNGAIAVLALYRGRPLVAVLQDDSCLTVLTWPQFLPRLPDFGRHRPPRKWGRLLRRLSDPETP